MKVGLVDIGNSLIKCGVVENGNFIDNKSFGFDEAIYIREFFRDVEDICYCSVVKNFDLKGILSDKKLFELNYENSLIKLNYTKTLGNDRIAKAHYIALKIKEKSMILDFGTATVIDVVDEEFIGGLILLGYRTWLKCLHSSTSKLPDLSEFDLNLNLKLIGNSTEEAILFGMINSYKLICLAVERKYNIKQKFITGGNAMKFLNYFENYRYEPYLALMGLYAWYERAICHNR